MGFKVFKGFVYTYLLVTSYISTDIYIYTTVPKDLTSFHGWFKSTCIYNA